MTGQHLRSRNIRAARMAAVSAVLEGTEGSLVEVAVVKVQATRCRWSQ